MSERGEVEVLIPLDRVPSRDEHRQLVRLAFDEATKLVARSSDSKGTVLGMTSMARASSLTGELALKVRFAVIAPEAFFERPTMIAVERKPV